MGALRLLAWSMAALLALSACQDGENKKEKIRTRGDRNKSKAERDGGSDSKSESPLGKFTVSDGKIKCLSLPLLAEHLKKLDNEVARLFTVNLVLTKPGDKPEDVENPLILAQLLRDKDVKLEYRVAERLKVLRESIMALQAIQQSGCKTATFTGDHGKILTYRISHSFPRMVTLDAEGSTFDRFSVMISSAELLTIRRTRPIAKKKVCDEYHDLLVTDTVELAIGSKVGTEVPVSKSLVQALIDYTEPSATLNPPAGKGPKDSQKPADHRKSQGGSSYTINLSVSVVVDGYSKATLAMKAPLCGKL
jgi:hypothetical protein